MPRLPENVGQCDGKGDRPSKPDPLLAKWRRSGVSNSPAKIPTPKTPSNVCFQCRVRAAREPKPKRGWTAVDNPDKQIDGSHPNSGSNAFMEKKLPTARLNSAQSEAAQDSAIAMRVRHLARDCACEGNRCCARQRR